MKLYTIDKNYLDYLRSFDDRVPKKEGRPYVGVIVKNNKHSYFIPLTSTEREYESRTYMKLKDGEQFLGGVNIAFSLPVNKMM